nr:zinc ribbon domain-containing protein [uncultured Ruminococcus sp.]
MVCKNCNHEIDNGAMFCTYCGTPVEQASEPETQPVENTAAEEVQQNPYENVQTAQPEVNNVQQATQQATQQTTADSQPQQNPYSSPQYGQQDQTYYQQQNRTSYGQQFTNAPNNAYGANEGKYGNQYQNYNNGYNQQYNAQYQQTYNAQPVPPVIPSYGTPETQPVSVGGWIGVMLLSCLPIVNLIMLFVWAFSSSTKKSLKNYARAALIMFLIVAVITVIASVVLIACGVNIFSELFSQVNYYH